MHTLLIHQAFMSPHEAGGTRHIELARHAVSKGEQFTIVASDLHYLTGKRAVRDTMLKEECYDGVRVLRARTYPSLHRSFLWRVISFVSFMFSSVFVALRAGSIDLVMGTTPPIFQAVSAWLVAGLRGKPFLLEVRDLWPEFAIDMGVLSNPVLIKFSRWLERFLYDHATHILVNSPAYRDYLVQVGIPAHKVTLIPNGVDSGMFDPDARGESMRAHWGAANKFVVIYAGALGMANDLPTLLRAAERLRDHEDIQFIILGDGKERPNLERMARERQLANVQFEGVLPKSRMKEALAASDACVAILKDIPMFRTTYPNKVFDYMAAGRPTILAIDGVIRRVVEEAQGGLFVPPGNDAALADAVLKLYSDPLRAAEMGRRAHTYVKQFFDRRDQAEQFVTLLHQMVGK